jgi:hypothetical protein
VFCFHTAHISFASSWHLFCLSVIVLARLCVFGAAMSMKKVFFVIKKGDYYYYYYYYYYLKDNSKFTALRVPKMSPLVLLAKEGNTQGQALGTDKRGDSDRVMLEYAAEIRSQPYELNFES